MAQVLWPAYWVQHVLGSDLALAGFQGKTSRPGTFGQPRRLASGEAEVQGLVEITTGAADKKMQFVNVTIFHS